MSSTLISTTNILNCMQLVFKNTIVEIETHIDVSIYKSINYSYQMRIAFIPEIEYTHDCNEHMLVFGWLVFAIGISMRKYNFES